MLLDLCVLPRKEKEFYWAVKFIVVARGSSRINTTSWVRGSMCWDGPACLPGCPGCRPLLGMQQLILLFAPGETVILVSWLIEKG